MTEFINKVSKGNWDVTAKNDAVTISAIAEPITITNPGIIAIGKTMTVDIRKAKVNQTENKFTFEAGGLHFTFEESIF